jgi:hypothetical protein
MPTLKSITALPPTVTAGQSTTITVVATPDADPDTNFAVRGEVVGTSDFAEVVVTVQGAPAPLVFTLDAATASDGNVLVTADAGTLTPTAAAGVYTFTPSA